MTTGDQAPRVLAAIVNYNGAQMTIDALASVVQDAGRTGVRALVVDNGSRAADLAALEAGIAGRATLLPLGVNNGYAAACNAAARIAATDGMPYVWWLNNDVVIEPGALDALVAHMDSDPATAAATPATVDHETGTQVLGAGLSFSEWRGRVRQRFFRHSTDDLPTNPFRADALAATCVLVRIAALQRIGGMDESYFMYGEDIDWSLRARAAGFTLAVVPGARVRHLGAASSTPAERLRYLMRNRVRVNRARAGRAAQFAFFVYFVFGWLPAYTVGRLIPRFGFRAGLGLAVDPLRWNVGDARRRGRWRLGPDDQVIPRI